MRFFPDKSGSVENKAAFNIRAEAAGGIHACSAAVVSRNSSEMHHAADSATRI